MQIPVMIEPLAGNGFRARGPDPFALTADGATPEDALNNLRDQLTARTEAGVRIVALELSETQHPWAPFAGMFRDDPLFEEWQKAIAEYRQSIDDDPDAP